MSTPTSGNNYSREYSEPPSALMPAKMAPGRARAGTSEPGTTSFPITPAFILRSIARWWKIATPIAIILAAIGGSSMWYNFEPIYVATGWLRVTDQQHIAIRDVRGSNRSFVATQTQLIRSPLVMEQVVAHPDVAKIPEVTSALDPLAYLTNGLIINGSDGTEFLLIAFKGPNPENAAKVVNATIESYFKMQAEDEAMSMQRIINFLENEKTRRKHAVEEIRDNLREMTVKAGGIDPLSVEQEALERTLQTPLSKLLDKITEMEVDRELHSAQLKAFDERVAQRRFEVPADDLEKHLKEHPALQKFAAEIQELQRQQTEIESVSRLGTQDPRYRQYEQLRVEKERLAEETQEKIAKEFRDTKRKEFFNKIAHDRGDVQGRVQSFDTQLAVLKARYFEQLTELRKGQEGELEIEFRRSELRREERVLDIITNRIMDMRTEQGALSRVQLLRHADPPKVASNEISWKRVGVFALVGFGFPFLTAVAWERFVRRVDGPQQLWLADLNVVGEIAKLPVTSRVTTLTGANSVGRDVSLFEESIDSLRTCLVLSEPTTDCRVLVISSAVSGEGKTSVASQLAVSIARATGEPTLLIDADMRSPDIHNVFDIPNEPGLAQVLGHECSAKDAIVTTWSNYVHILPAGVLKASPHKLLGDGALKSLLTEVRAQYRHIIIDTSPILSASESLVLAKAADGALLCAMREVSRIDQVQRAFERLVNTGARPLGTVLNGVPTGRYAYLYGIYAYPRE